MKEHINQLMDRAAAHTEEHPMRAKVAAIAAAITAAGLTQLAQRAEVNIPEIGQNVADYLSAFSE